jgi:Tannase-like family of unknown function (DUF6351)
MMRSSTVACSLSWIAASVVVIGLLASAPGLVVPAAAVKRGPDLEVIALSTRSDTVTGGDVLVQIHVPDDTALDKVSVTLNGRDVTSAFVAGSDRTLTGLVIGLRLGRNTLAVEAKGRRHGKSNERLTLINHPIEGPVFSGPHEQPYICETQFFNLPAGLGNLGPALDEHCFVPTRVDYIYRSTADTFRAWPVGATAYPADLAMTTTSLGVTVPYIVRMETGVINRAIYQTTVLHDPLAESAPNFHTPPRGWNGRLIFTFGGGCVNGWYRQGRSTGGVTDNFMLSQGYGVASSSLNVFGNNCQDVTAAESMMMVKERFVETYGPVLHTIGFGCSGGSYQNHQIADNYPGLLDGIIPGCSFPEVGFGTINFITDGWILDHYFNTLAGVPWTDEEKRLVTGFVVYNTAPNIAINARRIDPRVFCGVVPVELRYDPVTNPTGVRCDVYAHTVNVYGRDPRTGFARRPLDNVGIQYGLKALNEGQISKEQFLDLNEKIGGFDADANIVPERTVADRRAMRAAYQTGRLTNGGGGLKDIPIIDYRAYNDEVPQGDIHVRYHSFSMRARLLKANGTADNHLMLIEDNRYGLYSTTSPLLRFAIRQMDQWLTNLGEDTSDARRIVKIVRAKPAALREGCNTRDAVPTFIAEPHVRDLSTACEIDPVLHEAQERSTRQRPSRARWRGRTSRRTSSSVGSSPSTRATTP